MNKVNPFRALVAPLPLISLSNLSKIDDVVLVPSLSKTLLAKETVSLLELCCLNYLSHYFMFCQEIQLNE